MLLTDIAPFALAYLFGSIPFGLVLCAMFGYGDIRTIGSHSIGATNVLRTGSKGLALLTLILDTSKGALCVLAVQYVHPYNPLHDSAPESLFIAEYVMVGLFAILGHCFPVWLKFKGGKGVATTAGTLLAAVPYTGLAASAIWLSMAFLFKISSLAALTAALAVPIVTYFVYGSAPAIICALISLLVFIRHKDNIKRLIKGEESKINLKKKIEKVINESAPSSE